MIEMSFQGEYLLWLRQQQVISIIILIMMSCNQQRWDDEVSEAFYKLRIVYINNT